MSSALQRLKVQLFWFWQKRLTLSIQRVVLISHILLTRRKILSFRINHVHVDNSVRNEKLSLNHIRFNLSKNLVKTRCIFVYSLTEITRKTAWFTFFLNQSNHIFYHLRLIPFTYQILCPFLLLTIRSWCKQKRPLSQWMIFCKIWIYPNFDFTIIVNPYHLTCYLKRSQFIKTVLVPSERFCQNINWFLES